MSLKINDMRKCHPHQGFWRRGEVGDFASRVAREAKPRSLTHAVAIRYKDSGASEPKAVIFRGICRLQRKSARFSVNLNAHRASDQGFGPWNPSMLPPIPRLNGTGEKSQAEGPQLEWDACATQSPPSGALWHPAKGYGKPSPYMCSKPCLYAPPAEARFDPWRGSLSDTRPACYPRLGRDVADIEGFGLRRSVLAVWTASCL